MRFDIQEWYIQKQQEGETILDFQGDVTSEVISGLLNTIELDLDTLCVDRLKLKKKVYHVFVECLQNLFHHSDVPPLDSNYGTIKKFGSIILAKEGAFFRITTGNFVIKEKQRLLKDRIDQLNSLTDDEIKILYRDILKNESFSKKGGGGLGMLDIVRKTGNKLDYFFYGYNDSHLFFTLDIYIS
ncbi:MAG: SiaB family protein kinase [Marinilabiliaceae bacterium]|nr:SiaB family protein kinase [Marinilabiliaceae bacterium]